MRTFITFSWLILILKNHGKRKITIEEFGQKRAGIELKRKTCSQGGKKKEQKLEEIY